MAIVKPMTRRLPIFLAILVSIATVLILRARMRAQAEAELWAEATDEL